MPFDTDTRVVPSNIVLDKGLGPSTGRGDLGVGTPQFAAKITLALVLSEIIVDRMGLCSSFRWSLAIMRMSDIKTSCSYAYVIELVFSYLI